MFSLPPRLASMPDASGHVPFPVGDALDGTGYDRRRSIDPLSAVPGIGPDFADRAGRAGRTRGLAVGHDRPSYRWPIASLRARFARFTRFVGSWPTPGGASHLSRSAPRLPCRLDLPRWPCSSQSTPLAVASKPHILLIAPMLGPLSRARGTDQWRPAD